MLQLSDDQTYDAIKNKMRGYRKEFLSLKEFLKYTEPGQKNLICAAYFLPNCFTEKEIDEIIDKADDTQCFTALANIMGSPHYSNKMMFLNKILNKQKISSDIFSQHSNNISLAAACSQRPPSKTFSYSVEALVGKKDQMKHDGNEDNISLSDIPRNKLSKSVHGIVEKFNQNIDELNKKNQELQQENQKLQRELTRERKQSKQKDEELKRKEAELVAIRDANVSSDYTPSNYLNFSEEDIISQADDYQSISLNETQAQCCIDLSIESPLKLNHSVASLINDSMNNSSLEEPRPKRRKEDTTQNLYNEKLCNPVNREVSR